MSEWEKKLEEGREKFRKHLDAINNGIKELESQVDKMDNLTEQIFADITSAVNNI